MGIVVKVNFRERWNVGKGGIRVGCLDLVGVEEVFIEFGVGIGVRLFEIGWIF